MLDTALFDAYFFDLDGTIFLGDRLLPDVEETLATLRKNQKKVMFLTNTTVQTREDCLLRLSKLGVDVLREEIMTAAYAAALYFQEKASTARVLIVGEPAMEREMMGFPIKLVQDPKVATHVLVGMDRTFTYEKLRQAADAVRGGAQLIVANPDPVCPVQGGAVPDTGSLARAIETASEASVSDVIGKPSPYYAQKVFQLLDVLPKRCLMVGDRLETDILLGKNSGMKTALVLTGVTTKRELEASEIVPDYILPTLGALHSGQSGEAGKR
ncbi:MULTISPECIES: HAD-IIA family hydrolase [Brevibacillus]|uniref:Acid sugar phosphatase n=1 Tax=Brevibacillus invocatus TaxID=173959 RepID=A0A3M8CI61_9BACL|nr:MULTISPECIES: HAD-IIA family hydrolase [Brevibacillus]MDH4616326.1 HAD-IIA family hydrolase [Brevibacillus sp. AY1]RNB74525.1 HAD-IIA family hydrolase [Brevibacillus invocatus]